MCKSVGSPVIAKSPVKPPSTSLSLPRSTSSSDSSSPTIPSRTRTWSCSRIPSIQRIRHRPHRSVVNIRCVASQAPSALRYRQECFGSVAVLLGAGLGAAAVLGLGEALFGVGELLFQRRGVELLGGDRLLDQELGPVAEDLQPAVGLGVALSL